MAALKNNSRWIWSPALVHHQMKEVWSSQQNIKPLWEYHTSLMNDDIEMLPPSRWCISIVRECHRVRVRSHYWIDLWFCYNEIMNQRCFWREFFSPGLVKTKLNVCQKILIEFSRYADVKFIKNTGFSEIRGKYVKKGGKYLILNEKNFIFCCLDRCFICFQCEMEPIRGFLLKKG
jgi:hypothetical protein